MIVFIFLHGANHALIPTVVTYFMAWGVLSPVVNFLEGDRDQYGWAGFITLIGAIAVGGCYGMDEDTKSRRL